MNSVNYISKRPLQGRLPGLSLLNMWFPSRKAINVKAQRAFTLIEMMVAVSIFAVVMLVGVGSLLALVQTNRRAQAINSVMNNLNAAVESMARTMRVGTTYHCELTNSQPGDFNPKDCPGTSGQPGGLLLAFRSASEDKTIIYRKNGTQLERSLDAGAHWVALTAPDVSIDSFNFYVVGAPAGDGIQPRILMRIKGSAQVPGGLTTFTVQSSVVQRLLDI